MKNSQSREEKSAMPSHEIDCGGIKHRLTGIVRNREAELEYATGDIGIITSLRFVCLLYSRNILGKRSRTAICNNIVLGKHIEKLAM